MRILGSYNILPDRCSLRKKLKTVEVDTLSSCCNFIARQILGPVGTSIFWIETIENLKNGLDLLHNLHNLKWTITFKKGAGACRTFFIYEASSE